MDLKSPTVLAAAWVLVPAAIAAISAGLGVGLRLVSGVPLRALTLPAGYLAGVAIVTGALEAGLGATAAVAACLALAAMGPGAVLVRERARVRGVIQGLPRRLGYPAWAALAALAAYALALMPVVGSGRSAVLGYGLNNDSVFHISLVHLLAEQGTSLEALRSDSYHVNVVSFENGYPLGSYAWPLVGHVASGLEVFHLWSPILAVTVAMIALVGVDLLRGIGAGPRLAAIGGATAAVGSLTYAFVAQGGGKEVLMPLAVIGAVALAARPFEGRVTSRSLLPAALASAAAIANLGLAAGAWLAPAGALVLVWLGRRAYERRSPRELRPVAVYALALLPATFPALSSGLNFFRHSRFEFEQQDEVGNLLEPVPWREALNVWLSLDYRFATPDLPTLTWIGTALAIVAAAVGVAWALARHRPALPIALLVAVVGTLIVTPSVSIYFDVKTYAVLAPVLGVATAAGVIWALSHTDGRLRLVGGLAGVVLLAGVLGSAAMTYAGAWATPRDRIEELAGIGDRFSGQGPMLVNDREYYTAYLLRETRPWHDYGERAVERGLRFRYPPGLPHSPDFDDYQLDYFDRFPLLIERRRPGGSRPPSNYEPVHETEHYRVWRRVAPTPRQHLPLGLVSPDHVGEPFGRGNLDGSSPLRCETRGVRRLVRRARAIGSDLLVALPAPQPLPITGFSDWIHYESADVPVPPPHLGKRPGGLATKTVRLREGRYQAWLQGSFGPGVRLYVNGLPTDDVVQDLGLPSGWFRVADFAASGPTTFTLVSLERSALLTGSEHHEVVGPLVVTRAREEQTVVAVAPEELRRFCGRPLDWIEIPR